MRQPLVPRLAAALRALRLRGAGALLLLALASVLTAPAEAFPSCSVSMQNVAFGLADVLSGSAASTTAAMTITCTAGPPNGTIRSCLSIDAGSAADTTSRQMIGPGNAKLRFDLYADAAMTQRWGSYVTNFDGGGVQFDFPTNSSGNASVTKIVYAKLFGAQQTAPPGNYSSTFAGGVQMEFGTNLSKTCPNLSGNRSASASFTASASVVSNCVLSTANLNFGSARNTGAVIDAQTSLSVQCSVSLPYTVGLDGGNAGATDPTQRRMSFAGRSVLYGLYRNTARTQPWGASAGVNTAAGTGTGLAQAYPVYGRVPAQPSPPVGTYSDTIVVTVTY